MILRFTLVPTGLLFTCSSLTIKTLENGVTYVQVQQRKTPAVFIVNFLVFLLLTLNIFQTFF